MKGLGIMCGIAGWIDWQRDLASEGRAIEGMTRTLSKRGPDDEGYWLSPRAALGHRRLVVVDPAGGGQPMVRRRGDETYVLVYNGELYNTEEIRTELRARGHVFAGHSDTEVLLLSYIEWGPACVERFNGIWAFGVWRDKAQDLFLSRDRMGVKPLFFAEREGAFLFASELKAILAHPAIRPEVDAEGLAEIFLLGPARTPGHGVFRGVRELRPGHNLLLTRVGVEVRPYWQLASRPQEDDLETAAIKVRGLLRDTVERQLVADVPVCTLLSGGLDSSAITAFAAGRYRREGRQLVTFSLEFAGNEEHFAANQFQPDLDAPWVREVSAHLGTEHHRVVLDPADLPGALREAMLARDLPGMADIDASLLLFCREIKKRATVALSGESADEIFGGYPWFHRAETIAAPIFPWSRLTRARAGLLCPELRTVFDRERFAYRHYLETVAETPRLAGEEPGEARIRELFHLNLTWFLANLLERKDRMSMASGLEVRVPFCDHRLVEYLWNVPWEIKNCDNRGKGLLRRALRGILPDPVLDRKKNPYPKTHHPGYFATVSGMFREILEDPNSAIRPLLDLEAVRGLFQNGAAEFSPAWFGQLMGGAQLFAFLIQVEMWLREYKVRVAI